MFQFYGMNYVPMRIYRVLIGDESIGLRRFLRPKRARFKLKMTIFAQLLKDSIIFPPWLFYVWIKVSRFGSQPDCNHLVKYVFFFVTVRATVNWLRILFLIVASSGLLYIFNLLVSIWNIKALFTESDEEPEIEYYNFMDHSTSPFLWVPS